MIGRLPAPDLAPAAPLLRGFAPIIDGAVRVLVLGSFPSAASLAAGQYYAHSRNQFWPIVSEALGEALTELPYASRTERLLAHGIGLWDVWGVCQRDGSLDSSIRQPRANDLGQLTTLAPGLRGVLFNGAAAGRFAARFASAGLVVHVLPSTSPAHAAMSLAQKRAVWRPALRAHLAP